MGLCPRMEGRDCERKRCGETTRCDTENEIATRQGGGEEGGESKKETGMKKDVWGQGNEGLIKYTKRIQKEA